MVHKLTGTLGGWSYHLDQDNDVLYLAVRGREGVASYGDVDEQECVVRRSIGDESLTGLTILDFWRRFGTGRLLEVARDEFTRTLASFLAGLPPSLAAEIKSVATNRQPKVKVA